MKFRLPFVRKKSGFSSKISSTCCVFPDSSPSSSRSLTDERPPAALCGRLNSHKQTAPEKCAISRKQAKREERNVRPLDSVRELQEAFRIFDRDGDGKISAPELGSVLRLLGGDPAEEEVRLMVKEVDKDGDGYINLEEFISLNSTAAAAGSASCDELRDVFHIFDADNNGFISSEELHQVFQILGEVYTIEQCCQMIKSVDKDGDGFVDFDEFQRMMTCNDLY